MKIIKIITIFITLIFTVFANATNTDTIDPSVTTQSIPDNGLLLISTLDGFLSAIDVETGSMKWRFKEEPVLHCSRNVQTGFVLLPSPKDGQLYVLEDGDLGKLPYTIPQLVKASPSKTHDGMLFAGSKKDVWISINPENGSKMETLPPPKSNSFCPISHPETIFIGRTEYQLTMLDTKNKLRKWNVTFTDYSSHLLPQENNYPFQHFTNDGKIATFDKETGKLLWIMNYQGVIVNLYLLKSDGLHLLPSQTVGKNLFEELTEDDVAPDLSWFDTIKLRKSSILQSDVDIEMLSNGKLRSSLYIDETISGLFALPMIIDNISSTLPKMLGPRLMDKLTSSDSIDINDYDVNQLARRPNLPKNIPISMTTYKTVDGEYLLLGFHKYPKLTFKMTLDVSDPTNMPYLTPYHYLEYQTKDGNQVTGRCIGKNCNNKKSTRRGQKLLPGRIKPLEIEQEHNEDMTFTELLSELWLGYPKAVLGLVITFLLAVSTTIYMCGRASATNYNYTLPSSRETSHTSQRSKQLSEQSKKTWTEMLFRRSDSKSSSGIYDDEDVLEPGWRKIGKIEYDSTSVLGQGCEGTIVYKGKFDGREAAVKRVITEIVSFVDREIDLLRESDRHPNVIRYFCSESNHTFRFIALELCDCSIKDYVLKTEIQKQYSDFPKVEILRQASEGLAYLHQNNIVHRDIKPQNILLTRDNQNRVRVLISDFGLCKKIRQGHASISRMSGLAGTEGWIAPEAYMDDASITCLVDVFSLGCLYFYVLTNGKHPFGDTIKRQNNILKGEYDLVSLTKPDTSFNIAALNLIENMIQLKPKTRPRLHVVLSHPMFWSNERILQFFMDVSDRIEKEDENNDVVRRLEMFSTRVSRNWHNEICEPLKQDLRRFRSYRNNSIRDLLRALRNKKHHYRELPSDVKESLGEIPNGYVYYWTSRFPRLLMHIYNAMICCAEEAAFATYYPIEAHSFCNRRLEEELNTDFIVAGPTVPLTHTTSSPVIANSPIRQKKDGTPSNWRNENGPISANAAKKNKKKKKNRAQYSVLAEEIEDNDNVGPEGDAKDDSPN